MSDYRIVILQRGWVAVGNYRKEGQEVIIENASIIRIWGTTKGLGQLALHGPQENTVLDPCGTLKVHELAVIGTMDTEIAKWQN